MSEKKPKKIQSRSWQLIVPSEWEELERIKEIGKRVSSLHYFIEHKNDVNELGEPVKPHWHLLMTMSSSRDLNTVRNYFADIEKLLENSFEKINSIHWAKRYLVHADDPNKWQYSPNEVETNDKYYKDLFISNQTKIEETKQIIAIYKDMDNTSNFNEFLAQMESKMYTMSNHQRSTFIPFLRRYYHEFKNNVAYKGDGFSNIDPPYDPYECEANSEKYKVDLDNIPF